MTVIVCIDNRMGMLFNHRRQSRDRVVTERILALSRGHTLRMNAYSARLFGEGENIAVSEDFLSEAGAEDICFAENVPLAPVADRIHRLILFRWNRDYPADVYLDLPVDAWQTVSAEDIPGSSHECITREVLVP